MIKNLYFDKPYTLGDYQHICFPLIVEDSDGKHTIGLIFRCNVRWDYPDIHVYYDDCDNEFHIVIPNPVCPRWPMLLLVK